MSSCPPRCFSCGKVISNNIFNYIRNSESIGSKEILDKMGYDRFCCRARIMGHINQIKDIPL